MDDPVTAVDTALDGGVVWPCLDCLPWHLQVLQTATGTVIREWHAVDCPAVTGPSG